MSRRLIALLILTVTVLTACGRVQSTKPAAAGYLLFLEEGFTNGGQQITVRDSGTGKIQRQLPIGTAAPDWSRYYTVTPLSGSARLTAIDPGSGQTLAQTTIPAGYALPNFGYAGTSAGLSPNGQWLALTSQGKHAGSGLVTNFLVGASSLSDPFLSVQVDGDFSFDALSNDGRSLYLIQKMSDPNHYQVRLYDISARSLVAQPVVDKREPDEPMEGIRGDSVADPNSNQVYTVYVRDRGPCGPVYLVNTSLGMVAELTTGTPPAIARTKPVALNPDGKPFAALVTDAEAKGPRIGGAALSADGRTLFAVGETGLVAIDTATLKVRVRILSGEAVDSIRLSSDGRWLYAAGAENSDLWQIDPETGTVRGQVKGVTQPWALLWAEPTP
ncbi:MAG: hypothetical protein E6I96_04535 [Chloroflexi bacterium]|nr:MAG: hypothetical protein E6I96_04535 [Chloroflexota bacterium]